MPNALLTINTTVPYFTAAEPVLVTYDDGDWDLAFAGDVDWIKESSPSYLGATGLVEILDQYRRLLGQKPITKDKDTAHLFLDATAAVNAPEEPVATVDHDGDIFIVTRWMAENRIESGLIHNFIPLVEVLEESRQFISRHRETMTEAMEA